MKSDVKTPPSQGLTVWFTGLSGAGKSTISQSVHQVLLAEGYRTEVLDGDQVRQHLGKELGFSQEDRDENVRRLGFVADLLTRNGVIVLVAAISPYRATRNEVRARIVHFLEVYVSAPLSICQLRDTKGLYEKAKRGYVINLTGVDDPYEHPLHPDVECQTDVETIDQSAFKVLFAINKFLLKHPLSQSKGVEERF